MARPTKFKPEFIEQAKKLVELGAVDTDLAEFFKVHIATIYRWKVEHEAFRDALNEYKKRADDLVERSLFERALGYSCPETKVFMHEGQPVEVDTIKHYPPDTTAQIFWLKNRRPDQWRANPEDNGGNVTIQNIMPVPSADSVENWEASAQANQDKLLNR